MRNRIKLIGLAAVMAMTTIACENYEDDYLDALDQIEALEQEIADYSKQLEDLTNQTIVDANQIEALNAKLAEVENALIEANQLSDERKEALDNAHNQINELEQEIAELNETIEALETSGNASAELIAALQQEVEDAEAQIVYVQNEVEEIVEEANEVVPEPIAPVVDNPVVEDENNDEDDDADVNVCDQDDKWYLNGENVFPDAITPSKSQFADKIGENVGTFVFTFRAEISCTDYTVTVTSTKTIELGDEETEEEAGEGDLNNDDDTVDIVRLDNHVYTYSFSGFIYDGETEVDSYGEYTIVDDKTPSCSVVNNTWFSIVDEYADYVNKVSGTYTDEIIDVTSDCVETINIATIVVSEEDFNTTELDLNKDINGDGDKIDGVILPLKSVHLTFKGKTDFVIDHKVLDLAVVTLDQNCANDYDTNIALAKAWATPDNLKDKVTPGMDLPSNSLQTYIFTYGVKNYACYSPTVNLIIKDVIENSDKQVIGFKMSFYDSTSNVSLEEWDVLID